ncbi:MAG: GNAT family N-acetyltransferase [Taibaiella sp.]|nr:GNAT family N-acetyltransferase [Taibaiella sp.]
MDTVMSKGNIILKTLSDEDALAFYRLYNPEGALEHVITGGKSPLEFTRHIISLCDEIYSIRMLDAPDIIIGDCALHDLNQSNREIEIGGTLLPGYWGKGIMKAAFELLIARAQQQYLVDKIIAKTEKGNLKALKFAQKMGFKTTTTKGDSVMLIKYLDENIQTVVNK